MVLRNPDRHLRYNAAHPFALINGVDSVTPDPDSTTFVDVLQHGTDLRTLISYTGSLTSVTLQLWLHAASAPNGVVWYKGEAATLDPADGPVVLDWPVGDPTRFHIQVSALEGAGSITVLAYHVSLGTWSRRA